MNQISVRDAVRNDPEMQDTMAQLYLDKSKWCRAVFPERFWRPFSPRHRELFDVINNKHIQKFVAICFRGFGKTSILQLATPSHGICFQEYKFIMPVSATATAAVLQGENLKHKLTTNDKIRQMFGPMKSDVFAKDMWITSTGTVVFPRGAGQQVRSNLFGDSRPDLIPVDDLEDKETVRNEEQRAKTKEWFFSDLLGCVDAGLDTWRIPFIGTLLHEDSLLANLYEDPEWVTVDIPLCDEDMHSLWPEYMNDEQVAKLAESFERQGMMDQFYREYMNKVTGLKTQIFSKALFKYYDESVENLGRAGQTINMVIVDPAKSISPTADDSAIVGIAVQPMTNRLFVRDVISGKFPQDQLYDQIFAMVYRLGARVVGVEVDSLHEFVLYPLKNEISRRGLDIDIQELKSKGKEKAERIRNLLPLYRRGLVYHNKHVCHKLESQLVSFPYSKHDDVMDALAYAAPLLTLEEVTMLPTTTEYDYTEGQKVEDEYKDLEREDYIDYRQYTRI